MCFGEPLPNVLGHPRSKQSLNLAGIQPFTELLDRCDAELFVDTQNALRIEARMIIKRFDRRGCRSTQGFQFGERARQHDLADRTRDGGADSGELRKIRFIMDELIQTLRKGPNLGRRPLVSPDFVRILFLRREQLGQARQAVRYLSIA